MKIIKAGIVGVTGYAGTELARWLLVHPYIDLKRVYSTRHAGSSLSDCVPSLFGCYELTLETPDEQNFEDIDVLFLATPHGAAKDVALRAQKVPVVVDLSRDHRHVKGWTYGQPEWKREDLIGATRIAAPGCFATAISLAMAPLVHEEVLHKSVQVCAATGSTGSGATPKAATHHPDRFTNLKAYKVLSHQHVPEICSFLSSIGRTPEIRFVPLSAPVDRGIFATVFVEVPPQFSIEDCFRKYYEDKPLIRIRRDTPQLRWVRGTAFADIAIHQQDNQGVVLVAIDNLGRGASAQALQATNVSYGFPETTGIHHSHSTL
ncbi:MAG: N-acetyl-gamma-glutamyl-phosphate reductase [Myxococcota bacterium]|nr:N-acetyl-gamma-glutamyl-phosphate reductase [Myxococcota bacterium]